jgi:hypothetical protein
VPPVSTVLHLLNFTQLFLDYCIAVYPGSRETPNNAQQGGVTIVVCPPPAALKLRKQNAMGALPQAFGLRHWLINIDP